MRDVKMHIAADTHGFPMAVDVTKANAHDSVDIVGTLEDVAELGCTGMILGDLGYYGFTLDTHANGLGLRGDGAG